MQATYRKSMVSFFHTGSHTTMGLYILEQPSSWSTLEYISHGLDPGVDWASCWFSFPRYILVMYKVLKHVQIHVHLQKDLQKYVHVMYMYLNINKNMNMNMKVNMNMETNMKPQMFNYKSASFCVKSKPFAVIWKIWKLNLLFPWCILNFWTKSKPSACLKILCLN